MKITLNLNDDEQSHVRIALIMRRETLTDRLADPHFKEDWDYIRTERQNIITALSQMYNL